MSDSASSLQDVIQKEARLIILDTLKDQPGYSLGSSLLQKVLESFGINRSQDFVEEEINFLATIGAVTFSSGAHGLIATATPRGLDHVEGRVVLRAVKKPEPKGK
jgi:hypothetical protein